jgi:hypothetical protein
MPLVSTTRLLVCTVPLGICMFSAGWTATQEFIREDAQPAALASAVRKLVRGEVLRDAQPPAPPTKGDPDSPHVVRRNGNAD